MLLDFIDELHKVGQGLDAVRIVLSLRDAPRLTGRQASSMKSRLVVDPFESSHFALCLCSALVYTNLALSVCMHPLYPITLGFVRVRRLILEPRDLKGDQELLGLVRRCDDGHEATCGLPTSLCH